MNKRQPTQKRIAVVSSSFSKNDELRRKLLDLLNNDCFIDDRSVDDRSVDVVFNDSGRVLQGQELIEFINHSEVVIAGTELYNTDVLNANSSLKFIAKYGVGLDNIDFSICERLGIQVGWKSGVNKLSVAEMVLGFMISLRRHLYQSSIKLKQGEWLKNGDIQLSGQTIGIIGVGHIGKEVIRLLEPFNCVLLVNDIIDQGDYYASKGLYHVSKDHIYEQADIITVHVDLTDQTRHMINDTVFNQMKSSSFLINTSRGSVVVQSDLKHALMKQTIAGAAIDVFEEEPVNDPELLGLSNLFCTPHIGGNSKEAVLAMGNASIELVSDYLNESNIINLSG